MGKPRTPTWVVNLALNAYSSLFPLTLRSGPPASARGPDRKVRGSRR
ncbi:hypothetical protein [Saccharothrix sp. NRRL B-16314]|nr:hypothetical protein [Saccharothrix sp. NRRL B-16314]